MAREKKTITVAELKRRANTLLAAHINDHIDIGYKRGVATMLEWSLMQAGAYKGYRYLDNENCALNTLGYWEREYF